MKLRRYDIKKIYGDPKLRRELISESTRIAFLREGVELTIEECLESYDTVMCEKRKKI